MDKIVLDYIQNNRVCALAVQLEDGTPHTAALHYSHVPDPVVMYFSTENTSKKCEALITGKTVKGSVTIGFSEEEWITLQMDGDVSMILDPEELKAAKAIHYPKHPNSQKFENDPATVFLKFVPKWWRYTDYNTKPMTVISG